MDNNDFYKLVNIDECEIISSKYYLEHRGIIEHIKVANYLQTFIANRKVKYSEVATAFRYDKRIRRILYKYFGYLEENIRAYISNNFTDKEDFEKYCIKSLSKKEKEEFKKEKTINDAISGLLFRKLLYVACDLPKKHIRTLFPSSNDNLNINKDSLIILRNKVGHNIFLIDNHDLKYVTLSDDNSPNCTLRANILNLSNFLPSDMGKFLISEINNASKSTCNKHKENKKWNLIANIIITL